MILRLQLCCVVGTLAWAADTITHGPWIGAVTPTSALVTARVSAVGLPVRLVVSTNVGLSSPLYSAVVTSGATADNVVRLPISGLTAGTTYYLGLELSGALDVDATRRGTFRTFPSGAANLKVAFGSCSDMTVAGPAFTAIAAANPDLFINTGDFHYDDTNTTVADNYRSNYKSVFATSAVAPVYRGMATAYMWDDHDYCGNNSDKNSTGRATARAVFREWVPHYALADTTSAVYQAFDVGRVRVIMTDLRSECDPFSGADSATKSRMGTVQKAWFKAQLIAARDAETPLIAWVCTMPWIAGVTTTTDNWGAFATERREIADFIKANKIQNVMLLSGDMHALCYDDGTNSDYATGGGAPLRVFHAAAMGRGSSHKGGPYSSGTPIPTTPGPVVHQFGTLDITDAGGTAAPAVAFKGFNSASTTPLLSYSFTAEPVRPLVPSGLVATGGNGQIVLTWADASGTETGFELERSLDGSTGWTQVATPAANATTATNTGLSSSTTYYYRLRAVHTGIFSAYTSTASAQTTDTTAPTWTSPWPSVNTITSSGFTVRAKTNETGTAYYVVVASGATAPTSAQVKARVSYGSVTLVASGSLVLSANTEATAAVSGLSAGTAYDVYVVAQDAVPNLQAAPWNVTKTTSAPSAPATPAVANEHTTLPTFSGTVAAGQTVHILVDGTEIGTAIANGSGAWSYTPGSALSQGSHSITTTVSVGSGTPSSASVPLVILVDTIAPAQPAAPTVGGTATAPVLSGTTAELGGSARILVDGVVAGTVVVDGAGAWTYTLVSTVGTHQVTVQILDAAGNASTASTAIPVTLSATSGSGGSVTTVSSGGGGGGCGIGGLAGLLLACCLLIAVRARAANR